VFFRHRVDQNWFQPRERAERPLAVRPLGRQAGRHRAFGGLASLAV